MVAKLSPASPWSLTTSVSQCCEHLSTSPVGGVRTSIQQETCGVRSVAECPSVPSCARQRQCPSQSLQKSNCGKSGVTFFQKLHMSSPHAFVLARKMREPTQTEITELKSTCCCGNGRCEQTVVLVCLVCNLIHVCGHYFAGNVSNIGAPNMRTCVCAGTASFASPALSGRLCP